MKRALAGLESASKRNPTRDAVGTTSEANPLYKEGSGYAALTPFSIDYSFVRDECGNGGVIIRFITEGNRIRFKIDAEAAKAANLTISSKLMRLG